MDVSHSKRGSNEVATELAIGRIQISDYVFDGSWLVADCRFDVLLGMPWNSQENPDTDYESRTISVLGHQLSAEAVPRSVPVSITAMGVKRFRRLLLKQPRNVEIYHVVSRKMPQSRTLPQPSSYTSSKDALLLHEDEELRAVLKKFESVFQPELPAGLPPERDVEHTIDVLPGAHPPYRTLYQLSPAELVAARAYVDKLLHSVKIHPSNSPYGAPLFFVKNGSELRGVVDYRVLNRITKRNRAPIPSCDEMFDRLGQASYFSKLDLKTGFHQIRLRSCDIEKTAFNTKYGQFEYLVMPMGLCNSPATFQGLMNWVLHDFIDRFLVVYIDDIIIYSQTREEHLVHIRAVLKRLQEHKLYASPKKCEFMKSETEFLGLIVDREGIRVHPQKCEVIKNWPAPQSLTELRSFVGLVQFFRCFIPYFSLRTAPLTRMTQKGSGIHALDDAAAAEFRDLKSALVNAPVLVPSNWKKPFRVHIDASQTAVGSTLTQLDASDGERAIAYMSRRLTAAEQNYTANERELLGLVFALMRFRCYLEGSTFEVITDNQVVRHFLTKKNLNRREARWLDTLASFNISSVTLQKGKIHVLGDSLSRIPQRLEVSQVELTSGSSSALQTELSDYLTDQHFGPIFAALRGDWPMDAKRRKRIETLLPSFRIDDWRLLYDNKLCVPVKAKRAVLTLVHDNPAGGHFAFAKTLARLSNYHWKHKSRDVERYCSGCSTCQQQKDFHGQTSNDPQALPVPTRRWGMVATDFIVKLPRTPRGFDAISTWVDRLSRRVRFVPCRETDQATDTARLFFEKIFPHHGLPASIISDRDPRFIAKFWQSLMSLCGVQLRMAFSRHPQTDGASEVMNRMVENYIRCF